MLNLAEFRGLAPQAIASLPSIVYFHENQLTYPVRFAKARDYHYAMTNLSTAMAADQVWFNSKFHRDSFLDAAHEFLNRMPDYAPLEALAEIRQKSSIQYPGIHAIPRKTGRKPGPCRLLWAGRWEHDKNPDDFFSAMGRLRKQGLDFRLSVVGQSFQAVPDSFQAAKTEFADIIEHWGFQATQEAYWQCLQEADIVVSTAHHEFFGIGMIEAMCAGAYPLLPKRLSYPEILSLDQTPSHQCFFYDGTVSSLTARLTELIQKSRTQPLWQDTPSIESHLHAYHWKNAASAMDQQLAQRPVTL
jgi:glycosyltransferase involved in cell wall biosynthesis